MTRLTRSELAEENRQLLALLAAGYTQPEAAQRMGIPVATVKSRVKNLLAAHDAWNITHLIVVAALDRTITAEQLQAAHRRRRGQS